MIATTVEANAAAEYMATTMVIAAMEVSATTMTAPMTASVASTMTTSVASTSLSRCDHTDRSHGSYCCNQNPS